MSREKLRAQGSEHRAKGTGLIKIKDKSKKIKMLIFLCGP